MNLAQEFNRTGIRLNLQNGFKGGNEKDFPGGPMCSDFMLPLQRVLHASTAKGTGSIPGQGTRIPHTGGTAKSK